MKRRIAVAALAALAWAAPAAAQVPGINVHLGARVGAYQPLGALAVRASEIKIESGLGIGASIELDIPLSPINVRANVEAAMDRKLKIGDSELAGSVDVVNITGDLVFRPLPRIVVIQPYLLLGGGVKRYSFNDSPTFAENVSDLTGHVGAGADFKLGPIAVLVEASDYISSFKDEASDESKLQNDVFLMVGFRIGML